MKTIIFNIILEAVETATEIPRERILSRDKEREVVDARSLLIHYLCVNGFTKSQAAKLSGYSRQCATALEGGFADRRNANGNIMSIVIKRVNNIVATKDLKTVPME